MDTEAYPTRVRALLGYPTDQSFFVMPQPLIGFQYDWSEVDGSVGPMEYPHDKGSDTVPEPDVIAGEEHRTAAPDEAVWLPEATADEVPRLTYRQPAPDVNVEPNQPPQLDHDPAALERPQVQAVSGPTPKRPTQRPSSTAPERRPSYKEDEARSSAVERTEPQFAAGGPEPILIEVPGRTIRRRPPVLTKETAAQDRGTVDQTEMVARPRYLDVEQPEPARSAAHIAERRQQAINERAQIIREQLIQQFGPQATPEMPARTLAPTGVEAAGQEREELQEEIEVLRDMIEELENELMHLQSRPAPPTPDREVIIVTSRPQTAAFWERRYQSRFRSRRM